MKAIVVYYSLEGNTKFAAELLAKGLQADLLELKPIKEYPKGKISKFIWGGKAATFAETPQLEEYKFQMEEYDFILIGTPVWNNRIAPPLNTFLSNHEIANKKVALFASSTGGKAEKTFEKLSTKASKVVATLSLIEAAKNQADTKEKVDAFIANLKGLFEKGDS